MKCNKFYECTMREPITYVGLLCVCHTFDINWTVTFSCAIVTRMVGVSLNFGTARPYAINAFPISHAHTHAHMPVDTDQYVYTCTCKYCAPPPPPPPYSPCIVPDGKLAMTGRLGSLSPASFFAVTLNWYGLHHVRAAGYWNTYWNTAMGPTRRTATAGAFGSFTHTE